MAKILKMLERSKSYQMSQGDKSFEEQIKTGTHFDLEMFLSTTQLSFICDKLRKTQIETR